MPKVDNPLFARYLIFFVLKAVAIGWVSIGIVMESQSAVAVVAPLLGSLAILWFLFRDVERMIDHRMRIVDHE